MKIQIGPKGSFEKKSQITPSTRDLMQFISPNPKAKSDLYFFTEQSGSDLDKSALADFENANIAGLIVDTTQAGSITRDDYLKKAQDELSCPLFRQQTVTEQDDLFDTRVLGFDGQITAVSHLDNSSFYNLYKLAEGFHFRLIPLIISNNDWNIIASATPQFIAIAEDETLEIPPAFQNARCFLMGPESMTDKIPLKCLIKKVG